MRVLIAEDNPTMVLTLQRTLAGWGYDVQVATDGRAAVDFMRHDDAPSLAILDWLMPEMDGTEVCRQIRQMKKRVPPYILILTVKSGKGDIAAGLNAGADDYLIKPFASEELDARLKVGIRTLGLQERLVERVRELEEMLHVCCYCKRIRDEDEGWRQMEAYFFAHTGTRFSHGVCPECMQNRVVAELARMQWPQSP